MPHRYVDLSHELAWRSFASLGRREAAFALVVNDRKDLSRHEFSCIPGTTNFCAIHPTGEKTWAWTLYDEEGKALDEGSEPTRAAVIRAAIDAQPLWHHRCAAKGECRCHRNGGKPH